LPRWRYGRGGPCKHCGRKTIPKTVKGKLGKYGWFYHQICAKCRFRRWRKRLKKNGTCTRCRRGAAEKGRTKCQKCLEADRRRHRSKTI